MQFDTLTFQSLLLIFFLLHAAFYSGVEAAFLSLNRIAINRFEESKSLTSRIILYLVQNFDYFIISLLLFNMINHTFALVTALRVVALFDPAGPVREEAVAGLGEIGGPDAVGALERVLLDPDLAVRTAAVDALAAIGDGIAAQALGFALTDEETALRELVVDHLGEIGSTEAIRLLQRALADESDLVREAAAERLAELIPSDS